MVNPTRIMIDPFKRQNRDFLVRKYGLKDSAGWKIDKAIADIKENVSSIERIMYRPYDWRYVLYTNRSTGFLGRPREKISRHFVGHENYGLLVRRNTPPVDFTHAYICDSLISEGILGIDPNGREYVFPLYLFPEDNSFAKTTVNYNDAIVKKICASIGEKAINPFDILAYTYAVLYSNKYRKEYSEFLKINYPRIPYPTDKRVFYSLVEYGKKLIDLHLLRIPIEEVDIKFRGQGNNCVASPKYSKGKVYINKTQFFEPIEEKYWLQMVGGYAPLQKWLKLRKNKELTEFDINTYKKIVIALRKTECIMEQIDAIITI